MPVGIYPIEKRKNLFQKGHPQLNTGRTRFKKGQTTWNKNKSWSMETRQRMSLAQGGSGQIDLMKKRYIHTTWTKEYRQWRSKVLERDEWTCQTCGMKENGLVVHHIKGWAKYPKLRYKVNNGVTLCKECHKLTHRNRKMGSQKSQTKIE